MTIDVEDYFQVSAMEDCVQRDQWDSMESRVQQSTDRMLALLERCDVQGTFYILGWVAERFPQLVQRIANAGHEIASHGYWHRLVYTQTPEQFAKDLQDSCSAIESACGVRPTAYRAPSFSITEKSLWALDVLVEQGFTDDSSVFPITGHDRYGIPNAKKEIHNLETKSGCLQEFPPSVGKAMGCPVPVGGGYFRLLPSSVTCKAIQAIERRRQHPAMFYIHPWEVDPGQPKVNGLSRKAAFRHYVGLKNTEDKLQRLMQRVKFGTMSQAIACHRQSESENSEQEMNQTA